MTDTDSGMIDFRGAVDLVFRNQKREPWDIGKKCLRCLGPVGGGADWGPLLDDLIVYVCDPCIETSDAPYKHHHRGGFDYRWGDVIQQVAREHPERFRDKDREMILALPHYTEGNSDGTDPSIVGKR